MKKTSMILKLSRNIFLGNQIKKGNKSRLGSYIKQTKERNSDSSNRNLLGVSSNKIFIQPRAYSEDFDVSN